jgi:leucyl aminopeptidase
MAEQAFAAYCVQARLTEATSSVAAIPYAQSDARARARTAASAVGARLYHFDATFGKPDLEARPKLKKFIALVIKSDQAATNQGLAEGAALAEGMSLARTLGNLPGNICTPTYLGEAAKKLGREFKSIKVTVLEPKQIEKLGMGSFLSVARGSAQPARFIVMHYQGKPGARASSKAASNPPQPWTR